LQQVLCEILANSIVIPESLAEEIHVNSNQKGQEINPLTVFSQLGRWMA